MAEACRHSVDVVVQELMSERGGVVGHAQHLVGLPQRSLSHRGPIRARTQHTHRGRRHVVCTSAQVNACLKSFQHHNFMEFNDANMADTDRMFHHRNQLLAERKPHLRYSGSASTCSVPAFICWVMCDRGRIPAHQPHRNQPGL